MDYLKISIPCSSEYAEILMAELAGLAFESFEEHEDGLSAYISEDLYDEKAFEQILDRYAPSVSLTYTRSVIPKVNWNELWESNFEPITVDQRVRVRATFHEHDPSFPYEIIIDPKMSFGTGHHSTTMLMLKAMLDIDVKDKTFLDLGTGTGILAIMAAKMGARDIFSTDIDDWCIENARENFERNGFPEIIVTLGTAEELVFTQKFEVVAANINKNVLLEEMPFYADFLSDKGILLLSGFYSKDLVDIVESARSNQISYITSLIDQDWCQALFMKE